MDTDIDLFNALLQQVQFLVQNESVLDKGHTKDHVFSFFHIQLANTLEQINQACISNQSSIDKQLERATALTEALAPCKTAFGKCSYRSSISELSCLKRLKYREATAAYAQRLISFLWCNPGSINSINALLQLDLDGSDLFYDHGVAALELKQRLNEASRSRLELILDLLENDRFAKTLQGDTARELQRHAQDKNIQSAFESSNLWQEVPIYFRVRLVQASFLFQEDTPETLHAASNIISSLDKTLRLRLANQCRDSLHPDEALYVLHAKFLTFAAKGKIHMRLGQENEGRHAWIDAQHIYSLLQTFEDNKNQNMYEIAIAEITAYFKATTSAETTDSTGE